MLLTCFWSVFHRVLDRGRVDPCAPLRPPGDDPVCGRG